MRPSPGSTCRKSPLHELLVSILGGILATVIISIIAVIGGRDGTEKFLQEVSFVPIYQRSQLLVVTVIAILLLNTLQKKGISIIVNLENIEEEQRIGNSKKGNIQGLKHKVRKIIISIIF